MTNETLVLVLGVLLGLSETLALFPLIKANSVFQLVYNILKGLKDKFSGGSSA